MTTPGVVTIPQQPSETNPQTVALAAGKQKVILPDYLNSENTCVIYNCDTYVGKRAFIHGQAVVDKTGIKTTAAVTVYL
jgi:hypothetical protein